MYTSVSACKILCGAGEDGVQTMKEMGVWELVVHLLKSKALGNPGKKQVTRCAQIALRLGKSSRCYKVFVKKYIFTGPSLSHLEHVLKV